MLEKLPFNWSDVTDVQNSIEPVEPATNRLGRKRVLTKNISKRHYMQCTLMDLVEIFTDEADKVCPNKDIARLIALESLNDYVKDHVNNLKLTL